MQFDMDIQSPITAIIPEETEQQNISTRPVKDAPTGILRLDVCNPRRISAEFKFSQKELLSPQPSVTFAEDLLKSDSSKASLNLIPSRMQQLQQQQSLTYEQDRVQFPEKSLDGNESDEDDYSASVNAIIQRRASTRRSKKQSRRASSPFLPETPGPERRRSSVFTTSSGDTAITVDDNVVNEVTQDEIFENIKLHKEVLSHVKMQPWNVRKKLKLVLQAKSYIKKHEGQLQERLAQSHSTKDMLARWNIVLIKKWQKWKRELTNMSMWFIPWELKIKEIESHFGSVVASYFIFLRWLFWVNIVIAVVIISFVTIPEIITADPEAVKERKFVLPEEKYNSTNFLTLWDFEGVFKYSPLFYGWYTNRDYNDSAVFNSIDRKNIHGHGYRLPFAYFVTGLVVYAFSFFATLRKMAENSRMSKLSEKDDECIFSWKLFTAWDYMIGNAETAHNRVASIVMGFKEALLEEAEKKRESRNWKVICFRVLVNTLVVGLLSCSAFAVVIVVKRSTDPEANSTVWRRNEITVVMSLITWFFPMLFEVLGFVEQYHPRKQLRLQLARIMVLNLLNLYSLIFALFDKITDMTILLQDIKTNLSKPQTTDVTYYTTPMSFEVPQPYDESTATIHCSCNDSSMATGTIVSLDMLLNFAHNLSTLAMPTLSSLSNSFSGHNITETFINSTETFLNSSLFPSTENFTYYYENSSLYWYENATGDINVGNISEFSDISLSLNDVKDFFVDYLTFMLSPFVVVNSTDSVNESLIMQNITIDSLNITTADYDYFKSTILPLFNNTIPQEEQRFDMELSSLFNEISTTISTLPDMFTTSATTEVSTVDDAEYMYCQTYCNSISDLKLKSTWSSTIASTGRTTVSYGEVEYRKILNYTMNAKLRSLCWETMFGQELIKLTVMDLIVTGLSILMMDFFRGIFVRVMNRCWCWDLEKKFPQYGDFKVAENILHLVNNQGMVWMGMFFSPGLVVLNVVKLYLLMYLRTWAVLTCNVPHEIIFRASRSNNFYYALLLMMLFLSVLPVGYAIVWIEPSWHCGPFSGYQKIFHIFTRTIRTNTPESMHRALDYIASPGIVIPLLLLLVLIIYYLVSLTGALREANNDLKTQLRRERTEERRKMFQLADRRRRGGSGESADQTPFSKWKKLLSTLPSTRSCDDARQESEEIVASQRDDEEEEEEKIENKGKVFFAKLIKKALGKSSTSDEEQDGTDTDQHDSLPYDNSRQPSKDHKPIRKTSSGGSSELQVLQGIVGKWSLSRNSQKEEKVKQIEEKHIKNRIGTKVDNQNTQEEMQSQVLKNKTSGKIKDIEDSREYSSSTDKSKDKVKKSALKVAIHKTSSAQLKRDEIINSKNTCAPRASKTINLQEASEHMRHQQHPPEKEKNIFLKRVIEAKQLGVFDDKPEKVIEGQPRAYHNIKEHKGNKSKPRKPIIELDENSFDQDQSTSQNANEIKKDSNESRQPTTKKAAERQDSSSSVWSDTIPVITISKTYSNENILEQDKSNRKGTTNLNNKNVTTKTSSQRKFVFRDEESSSSSDEHDVKDNHNKPSSFRPRVKCVLRKQANAIDEDVIIHFGDDLARAEADKQMILGFVNTEAAELRGFTNMPSTSSDNSDKHLEPIIEGSFAKLETGSASDRSTSDDTEIRDDNSVDTILNSPYYVADYCNKDISPVGSSVESPMEFDMEENIIEDDTELEYYEGNEESLETDGEEHSVAGNKNILDLQHPSMKSSSRSQTESSSYYKE